MKKLIILVPAVIALLASSAVAQTSWKGTSSTLWNNAANWTAGIPTATTDVIIGDTNFTGANQPQVSAVSSCKSLTLGTGSKASTLTINRNLTVSGDVIIGTNGAVTHGASTFSLSGNWTNLGTYTATAVSTEVIFAGTTQTMSGGGTFRKLTVNSSSTVTASGTLSIANILTASGTFDASASTVVSGSGKLTVSNGGKIVVRAATFGGNYAVTGTRTISGGSTVEYAAGNQTVDNSITYSTLRISGNGIKTLAGNLPALSSGNSAYGNIYIASGTLDLGSFTANRNTTIAGGTLTMASGATLKIGGANSFPSNYASHSLDAASTVEYYGANQTVTAEMYGNLILSSGGAATKTLPASAFTIAGNLSSATNTSGASVSFTAGAAITVNGSVTLGAGTTFNGSSFSHSMGANWTNNGTFTGATSTITMNGLNALLTGSGASTFNNLTLAKSGITLTPDTSITVAGNLALTGAGTFTHTGGGSGTVTMSGASKTISGAGLSFNNLAVSGSVSTSDSFSVAGNLNVTGSFSATGGTLTMSGASKTIYGGGTIALNALTVSGSISTTNNFSAASDISVSGTLTATAGTATFNGSSSLSGTANLFNITLNGTRLQLGAASTLGVAGALTFTAGTFDVATTVPNTVTFNGGAQTVPSATFDNLVLAGSGTKTAAGALTINRDLTINSGATFSAGSYTHSLYRNWINNGTFTAGTSTIQLLGSLNATLSGVTTFNALTVNKSSSVNVITLNTNVSVATLNMTTGAMNTSSNAVTVTTTRTGNGVILGTITRTHAFTTGSSYAFESPNNSVTFSSASGVTSISITTTVGAVSDFPFGSSINRQYNINVTASGAYTATLRLHYEDAELNGNSETSIALWRATSSWAASGKTGSDSANNWVEQSALTSLNGRWTLSQSATVARWTGSASSAWENAANWTALQGSPSLPPSSNDVAELGSATFVNQPTITSAASVKSISFGSAQAVTLTLGSGGSLQTIGNIGGSWTNAATHTLAVGAQTLTVGGDLALSDGTNGRAIHLTASSGSVNITGSLTESGGANVTFSGGGVMKIGGDFNYASGTFTPGTSTVIYNGAASQIVAPVTYNRLAFEKTGGTATLSSPATVNSHLTLTNAGTFITTASLTVGGGVVIDTGATLTTSGGSVTLSVAGDWTRLGTFTPGSATIVFNGGGAQSVSASTFNHFTINKAGGTATLAGNLTINGDASVSSGTLDLAGYSANRSAVGGTLTLASGTTLKIGGTFPANFSTRSLHAVSTVEYTGVSAQNISGETYGNLNFSNGGGNAKTLAAATAVAGDLTINSGATFAASSYLLTLQGHWTNNGTFTPGTSTVRMDGVGKYFSGTTTLNNFTIIGSSILASNVTVNGAMTVSGSFAGGANSCTFAGAFQNSGTFTSAGNVTFAGTTAQTLALNSGFTSTGTVNFNGSVAPVFADATAPTFQDVNINNTAGVTPNLAWNVAGNFNVASGSTFNGGALTHTFYGGFTNSGTVSSSGTLDFQPASARTLSLGGTLSSSGTVRFGGSGQISIAGTVSSLNSVTIANTHANGVTPNRNWTLAGDLTISPGATFHAGTGLAHTFSGNVTDDGTFDGQTSTITLNGTATTVSGSGSTVFNHLAVTGTTIVAGNISVSGSFTNNGSFDSTGFDLNFTGSGASVIAGSTSPTLIDSLVIAKSSATVTLAVNVSNLTALTISSGTLDTTTFSVTEATGGVLTLSAGGTLKLGGSNPLPTFDTYNFDPASTVEFAGNSAQTIAAQNYGNLTSSGSGARTLASSGTIGIAGTLTPGANSFTITGSTMDYNGGGAQTIAAFNYNNLISSSTGSRTLASTGTVGVAGAFTPGANSFTVTGSTINFNGAAQTIPAFTYGNLTISGSGTKTLGGNATVNGHLNLSAGTLADAGFTLTVNGNSSNAVTHTGAGKILFSGGSTNHILSGSGAYQNLELADTNGASLSATNLTINGTLTLTTGILSTSTNKVIIATGANLSRTNGHVNGWLQKNVATGATTRMFEVGDAANYAPVTVAFGNVTTAGNLVASTIVGDHPDIANSGIATNRSANRYWTVTNSGVVFNNYNGTFQFNASDLDASADTSVFFVAKKTSGVWTTTAVGLRTSTNTQATAVTTFGDFQLGQSASAPGITTQPLSQRVNLGAGVTFTIASSGATPLFYQWRKNGSSIPGATNVSYSITTVADTDAASYSCVVTNVNGSDISSNAVLTINHPPVITVISTQTINELTAWNYTNSVSDVDGGTLTWSLTASPSGMSIDASSGVISWTPTEAQGPSTNTVTVRVTDNGSPNLSDTKSFTVVVNEANTAPILTVPMDQTLDESTTTLAVSASATDSDIPTNTLTFSLVSAPDGMTINASSGAISWTPSAEQEGSTNLVVVRVSDGGVPVLSSTNSFQVIVARRMPPTFLAPDDQLVNELQTFSVTNIVTETRVLRPLTFSLVSPPQGMTIDATNGVITWTPNEEQGPGTNVISVVLSDAGTPAYRVTNQFTVIVREVNVTPVLPPQPDLVIDEMTTINITNLAADADAPTNLITYNLREAPSGALIAPSSTAGIIRWTPTEAQGPAVYTLTTVAWDHGSPFLYATNSFTVTVREVNQPPVLTVPTNQVIDHLTTLVVTNFATDPDLPANQLTFSLVSGPSGLELNPTNGVVTWQPSSLQIPSTNTIVVRVTDSNPDANTNQQLSDTKSFTVSVYQRADTTRPVANIVSPGNNSRYNSAVITLTGTAQDDWSVKDVFYKIGDGSFVKATGTTNWSANLTLSPGPNIVSVKAVDMLGNESTILQRTFFYVVLSPFTLQINGGGYVSPTLNGALLEIGSVYKLTATPATDFIFTHWSGGVTASNAVVSFVMQSNLVLAANFIVNPFIATAGTYNGLFAETNGVTRESAGLITVITTSKMRFSGKIHIEGDAYGFSGGFNVAGVGRARALRPGKSALTVDLQLDLYGGTRQIIGRVTESSWTAEWSADKTTLGGSFAGTYTLALPADVSGVPGGNGYALLRVSTNGAASLSGVTGDAVAFSQTVAVSRNGDLPFYTPIYKGSFVYDTATGPKIRKEYKGMVIGWLNVQSNAPGHTTSLFHIRTAAATNAFYRSGFTNEIASRQSRYVPPSVGQRFVDFSTATVLLEDGNLPLPLTRSVNLSAYNVFSVPSPNPTALQLTAAPKTGLITGKFRHPSNASVTTVIKAVVLQNERSALGYFAGTNATGSIVFSR